jgi:hypothetical protein
MTLCIIASEFVEWLFSIIDGTNQTAEQQEQGTQSHTVMNHLPLLFVLLNTARVSSMRFLGWLTI